MMTIAHVRLATLVHLTMLALLTMLFGCGDPEVKSDPIQKLSDIAPLKVIVSDFAQISGGGVDAVYRVRGSVFFRVPVGFAKFSRHGNVIEIKELPLPTLDERSITVEQNGVELLDLQRGLFTSLKEVGVSHEKLFASVHDSIRELASEPDFRQEAQAYAQKILEGFYLSFYPNANITIEWKEDEVEEKP